MSVMLYYRPYIEDSLRRFCAAGLHYLLVEDWGVDQPDTAESLKFRAFCHFDRLWVANVTAYNYQYGERRPVRRLNGDKLATLPDRDPSMSPDEFGQALRGYFGIWYNVYDNDGNGFLGGRDDGFCDSVRQYAEHAYGGMDRLYASTRPNVRLPGRS